MSPWMALIQSSVVRLHFKLGLNLHPRYYTHTNSGNTQIVAKDKAGIIKLIVYRAQGRSGSRGGGGNKNINDN